MDNHYLPQFYLRQWSNDGNTVIRWIYINNEVKSKKNSIKLTASEKNLYTIKHEPEKKHIVETNIFSPIDSKAALLLKKICNFELDKFDVVDKLDWTKFIISLITRHKDRLEFANKAKIAIFQKLGIAKTDNPDDPLNAEIQKLDDDIAVKAVAAMNEEDNQFDINFSKRFSETFQKLNWQIIDFSDTGFELITSDNPVLFIPNDIDSSKNSSLTVMLERKGYVLYVPLSPKIGFFASLVKFSSIKVKKNLIKFLNKSTVKGIASQLYTNDFKQQLFIKKHFSGKKQEF